MSATVDLGLADADGLDEHDVEAGCLDHDDRLARRSRDAAEHAGARRRPDEREVVDSEPRHARLVAEDAATGARRRRVDGEHGDAVAARRQLAAEGVDERRLPGPRHAGDADAVGAAGTAQQTGQQLLGRLLVVRPGRLDQRDRPSERRPVGRQDAGLVVVESTAGSAQPARSSSSSSTAASAMTVPGGKIADAPAARSAS